jgi:glycosyltransferase involved in cell wall biosynthesis
MSGVFMQSMLVTIMIPTYNQAFYLAEAIESALMQDYPALQVVVADDCSTDDTGLVASRYEHDQRFVYVRNQQNIGRVRNYSNTLLHHVDGEWVVNLDGDDYYTDKGFISDAIRDIVLAKDRDYDIVAYMGSHNLGTVTKWIPGSIRLQSGALCCSGKRYFLEYARAGQFTHMSCLYHTETAKRLGGYVFDFVASDFHALMRLFLQGALVISDKNVGVWRVHDTNASLNNLRHKYQRAYTMYEDLASFASSFFTDDDLEVWKQETQEGAYNDYILTVCAYASTWRDFNVLIKDFKFRRVYVLAFYTLLKRVFSALTGNHK